MFKDVVLQMHCEAMRDAVAWEQPTADASCD